MAIGLVGNLSQLHLLVGQVEKILAPTVKFKPAES